MNKLKAVICADAKRDEIKAWMPPSKYMKDIT